MELNRNDAIRDEMIGSAFEADRYVGGIRRFKGLTHGQLVLLVAARFADLEERQNEAPPIGDFLDFLSRYPTATVFGYAVTPTRPDYRVSIEGVEYSGAVGIKLVSDFVALCKTADELEITEDYLRAYWG